MRPETKAALLDELAVRGVHLDPKVEPKDATMKDVVAAIKKVHVAKKYSTKE